MKLTGISNEYMSSVATIMYKKVNKRQEVRRINKSISNSTKVTRAPNIWYRGK